MKSRAFLLQTDGYDLNSLATELAKFGLSIRLADCNELEIDDDDENEDIYVIQDESG